jgi:ankyrin repeat protein
MLHEFIKTCFLGSLLFLGSFILVEPTLASPIHEAAVAGDVELVEMLIEKGADVDDRDVHGYTPLILAIQAGNTDIAKVLINNGADVNASAASDGGEDVTPLYLSIILGHGLTESLLRRHGAVGPHPHVKPPQTDSFPTE